MISTAAVAGTIANSVPPYVATAQNLGAENPAKVINITVNLALHNRAERDTLLQQLYDRNSPLQAVKGRQKRERGGEQ